MEKILEPRKVKREKEKMDAESVSEIVKNLENFGGIFSSDQLENVKILDLPVMLIILDNGHWLSLYIDQETLEIMDSAGFTANDGINKHLCRFLCAQSYGKTLTATPQLQQEDSSDCGKYATCFLVFRSLTGQPLTKFAKIFSSDFKANAEIIEEIFQEIKKLAVKFD